MKGGGGGGVRERERVWRGEAGQEARIDARTAKTCQILGMFVYIVCGCRCPRRPNETGAKRTLRQARSLVFIEI